MSTQSKVKNLKRYVVRTGSNPLDIAIVSSIFNALYTAQHHRYIKFDHSPSDPNVITLEIDQLKNLIADHSGKQISEREILKALQCLIEPWATRPFVAEFISELTNERIGSIRLLYDADNINERSEVETDTCAEALQILHEQTADSKSESWDEMRDQICKKDTASEIDKCDASRRWIVRAMALETQHNDDQMTIALLRSIISELSEQLHAADSNARISLTSSELLELIHGSDDSTDTPF